MDIREIRRANLINLVGNPSEHGAAARFAAAHNLNPNQIRHILGRTRDMGEKLARKLEKAIGIPEMSLDKPLNTSVMEKAAEYNANQIGDEAMQLLTAYREASPELRAAALRMLGIAPQNESSQPKR